MPTTSPARTNMTPTRNASLRRPGRSPAWALLLLCAAFGALADTEGRIFPDPARPLAGFKPHELSFQLPADGVARGEYRSEPFYAVILKTAAPCSVTEAERLRLQALFPGRKLFSTRFECDGDSEENITYTNVNPKFGFVAVYAGSTLKEAQAFLAGIAAAGRFPGANLRHMRVVRVAP